MRQIQIIRCYLTRLLWLLLLSPVSLALAQLETEFARELVQLSPHDEITVIVTLKQIERPEAYSALGRNQRNGDLVMALKNHAEATQSGIKTYIRKHRLKHLKDIWIVNGMTIKLRADQVHELAALPGVVSVRKDEIVTFAAPDYDQYFGSGMEFECG